MKELWTRFVEDESGQGLVEYILIIAVVAIGLITALYYFRGKVGDTFKKVGESLEKEPANQYQT
jgi:pilus assembly protein Flp/PilA